MPKIQVYQKGRTIIPVKDAVTRGARQCPVTGDVYLTDSGYRNHIRRIRIEQNRSRSLRKLHEHLFQTRQKLTSLDEIFDFFENNPRAFFLNKPDFYRYDDVSFKIHSARYTYRLRCSNTHSCPRDGVQNFVGDQSKPKGYPGFVGRIHFTIGVSPEANHGFGLYEYIRDSGIKLHSGGGNGKGTAQYDSTVFLDDFPAMRDRIQLRQTMLIMQDKNSESFEGSSYTR